MKKITILLFFIIISQARTLYSQADLVVVGTGFQPEMVDKGDVFLVQATVKNIGNDTAFANQMFIYYSQDLELTPDEMISGVSLKDLAPGGSQEVKFLYPISESKNSGAYYIAYELDPYNIVPELDENNLFCATGGNNCSKFTITNNVVNSQKYNYPILFVHGLAGNSKTWDEFLNGAVDAFGWSYGGRFDYCLNPDDNQYTSDGFISSFVNYSEIIAGDYYLMNFDISTNGELFVSDDGISFNNNYSNQSAIEKQGWAVSDAVEKILMKTGADKVILVGHSMGGLAIRQYVQNPYNWQLDGEHHVAKLFTIGTPNGGSNASAGVLSQFVGVDVYSEAVRDLKHNGFPYLYDADFLFGGVEDNFSIFKNDDVNCNGYVGDDIIGLNQKYSPSNITYSCIVSDHLGLGSDDVVDINRADLNNYLLSPPPESNPNADKFVVASSHRKIHKENNSVLIQGLDEPAFYDKAYHVPLNSLNYGYSTIQAANSTFGEIDWDDYQVTVTESGLLKVDVWNIPVAGMVLYLLDADLNVLKEVQSFGESNIGLELVVGKGDYFIEIGTVPTVFSWRMPYAYSTQFESQSGLVADFSASIHEGCSPITVDFLSQSEGSVSSFLWSFPGGEPSSSNSENPSVVYSVPGVFPVVLTVSNNQNSNVITKNSYVVVKDAPIASYMFDVLADDTVRFTNQTQYDLEAPSYLWDFGDGTTASDISPVHKYSADGVYTVELKAINSCGSTIQTKNVSVLAVTSLTDVIKRSKINVFPNPASNSVKVKIEGENLGEYEILIFNSFGMLKGKAQGIKKSIIAEFQLDFSNLSAGAYFLKVFSAKENHTLKIIKR